LERERPKSDAANCRFESPVRDIVSSWKGRKGVQKGKTKKSYKIKKKSRKQSPGALQGV